MYSRRFHTLGIDGIRRGHDIVPPSSLAKIAKFIGSKEELHLSNERYNADHTLAGCPLSFDIDCDSIYKALGIANRISSGLMSLNIKHIAYFSGSKGFHIVVPKLITGVDASKRCQQIKKTFLNSIHLDDMIYGSKSNLRAEGSYNSKSGLYKKQVGLGWSIEKIRNTCSTYSGITIEPAFDDSIDLTRLENSIVVARANYRSSDSQQTGDLPPCIVKMFDDTHPPKGMRHALIYTYCKAMLSTGMSVSDVVEKFNSHPFWGSYGGNYYSIAMSIKNSGKDYIGCKNGYSAQIMRNYCSPICWFNENNQIDNILGGI